MGTRQQISGTIQVSVLLLAMGSIQPLELGMWSTLSIEKALAACQSHMTKVESEYGGRCQCKVQISALSYPAHIQWKYCLCLKSPSHPQAWQENPGCGADSQSGPSRHSKVTSVELQNTFPIQSGRAKWFLQEPKNEEKKFQLGSGPGCLCLYHRTYFFLTKKKQEAFDKNCAKQIQN